MGMALQVGKKVCVGIFARVSARSFLLSSGKTLLSLIVTM